MPREAPEGWPEPARAALRRLGAAEIAPDAEVRQLLDAVAEAEGSSVDRGFLWDEWRLIVDAWDVRDADHYRDLPRLGRKTRLAASRRDEVWQVFARVRAELDRTGRETEAGLMHRLARELAEAPSTHVVVDEAQDISVPELHLLKAMAGARPNGLYFAGDIGQRIFRSPFPWKSVGVDIQGRSRSLKVNYRTSHQIRAKSDMLLPPRLLEADGGEDNRLGVSSVFHGPQPEIQIFDSAEEESAALGRWLATCLADGVAPDRIAVLFRSEIELPRAEAARAEAGGAPLHLDTMHDAKGREYLAVAVMACDSDLIPSEERLSEAADERALKEAYDTERHLLYVAATRARERLWLSAAGEPSEFLEDLIS